MTPKNGFAAEPAAVAGVVRYQVDPQRPWRQGRYYMKSPRAGHLAEAVVALRIGGNVPIDRNRQPRVLAMDQKDYHFTPETITLQAGDSVKFTNHDTGIHNVHAFGTVADFNIMLAPGQEHIQPFPRAGGIRGPVKIDCVFHGEMRSWIFVFRHPYFAMTGEDGSFRLGGVPPGEYDLDVAHPAGRLRTSRKVTVRPGETSKVEILLSPDDLVSG
ncbi:MAG: carboxypeptidase regulatory-like domain-containing protein [Planctomycetes bacterium]|nr:carboxypeptidase regulatory-like domain-containing protein [Planctomycetota bacterium]